jgi:[protein-PII] uridylyltransferase
MVEYRQKKEVVIGRFTGGFSATDTCLGLATIMDKLIADLFEILLSKAIPEYDSENLNVSVIAIGGYGRGELFPESDVDLLFICPKRMRAKIGVVIEGLLKELWDAGLKVGHAVRSVAEAIDLSRADLQIKTSLLSARFICGDRRLYIRFVREYRRSIKRTYTEFIDAKLHERELRHLKMGDSRYALEPNVKEGKGGIRDINVLQWVLDYCYSVNSLGFLVEKGILTREELEDFEDAKEFLSKVRTHLHLLAGKPEERLTFNYQTSIAGALNYYQANPQSSGDQMGEVIQRATEKGVQDFMRDYYSATTKVGFLTRLVCGLLDDENKRTSKVVFSEMMSIKRKAGGYKVNRGRLVIEADEIIGKPDSIFRIFQISGEMGLEIHPQSLLAIKRNLQNVAKAMRTDKKSGSVFLKIISNPSYNTTALRLMRELGLLSAYLPEFAHVEGLTQFDLFHVYTVDEHIFKVIDNISQIEMGKCKQELPLASEVIDQIGSTRLLFLAALLHDLGKGSGRDQCEEGSRIAAVVSARLGLDAVETRTVCWLVQNHLLMSDASFRRDTEDYSTIKEFVAEVSSPARLRMLLLLTVSDIRAVAPNIWNGWKGALLRKLYTVSMEIMVGDDYLEKQNSNLERVKARMEKRLENWPKNLQQNYLKSLTPAFVNSFNLEQHYKLATAVMQVIANQIPAQVETRIDRFGSVTEVVIVVPNRSGAYMQIAGVVALCGANIVSSRAFVLAESAMVCVVWLQDLNSMAFDKPDKLARFAVILENVMMGTFNLEAKMKEGLPQIFKAQSQRPRPAPNVSINNKESNQFTVIEINAVDSTGLLFRILSTFQALGMDVHNSFISTFGEVVTDVFYITDSGGKKINDTTAINNLHKMLLASIG